MSGTVQARGVELAFSERGGGPAVMLVHETATDGAVWEAVGSAIEGGARAIALDRRGWGRSSAPDGYRRTTIEEQSEDVAAVAERASATPALLCGAGIGASIALDLLLRRPELAAGALLIEPPALGLVPAATEALSADRAELERAVAESGAGAVIELYLSGALLALGPGAERLPAELSSQGRERPGSLTAELGAPSAWSMPLRRLRQARVPSVIVTSASTPALLREAADALAARLAGSARSELEAPAGLPHLADAAGVAALLGDLASA